jgi:hypothetical protein
LEFDEPTPMASRRSGLEEHIDAFEKLETFHGEFWWAGETAIG